MNVWQSGFTSLREGGIWIKIALKQGLINTKEKQQRGTKRKTHTHIQTQPCGDFISLPFIAWLNNPGQGITSSGLDGSEQQSHTGRK